MTQGPLWIPVHQDTDAWLEARLDGIGSSDAPVVAQERGSRYALWAIKSRRITPPELDRETARLFRMGHLLEPAVAIAYTEETGRPLRDVKRLARRRDYRWAQASLDRVSARRGERRIVELKTSPYTRWTTSTEAVPGDVQVQVQHQLWVTGYDVADVAVLHRGYDLRIHEINRDDGFIADLVEIEREFWRWVETGQEPPADGHEATTAALARLYPRDTGEILPASPAVDRLMTTLRRVQAEAKRANELEASTKNALRAVLGSASAIKGAGYQVTWRANRSSTEIAWEPLVAELELRLARHLKPATIDRIQAKHTTTKPGARQLRPTWTGPMEETDGDTATE